MSYVPESNIRVKCYDHSNFSRTSVVQFRASWYIMSPNRTSAWKFMTIRISRELPFLNFERLDILFPRIEHPCEKLWPFEFVESFRCSILSILIYYVPKSDIRVKTYDNSNFSRVSVFQFRASRWVMSPNQTFMWKVMTIQICRELPLNSFERLDILYPRIEHPSEMLWPFEFLESLRCSISSVSIYYVSEMDIRVKSYDHSNFLSASVVQFRASRYIMSPYQTYEWNVMSIRIPGSFRCSISSVQMSYVPESDIRVKSYGHSNFSRTSVVQFWASRYIISPNRTSVWKVMTIRICWELPLFNFERLDILCPRIRHPSEMLWPFEFLESFRC